MPKLVGNSLDFNNASRLLNLPAPASDNEPARRIDLLAAIENVSWKDSARAASPSNINLASPGATIDGITMAAGDRVLVRNQTTPSANGIYIWNGAAAAMTRAPDASTASELEMATLYVEEGTDAGVKYRQTSVNFTLDSGAIAFQADNSTAPPASETTPGIAERATQAETDAATDDERFLTPFKAKNASWAVRKYSTTIGDGSATTFTVTHNLNTKNCVVSVYYTGGTFDEITVDVRKTTVNSVTIVFAAAPSASQFTVAVLG